MISYGLLEVEKERYEQVEKHDRTLKGDKQYNAEGQLRIAARNLLFAANPHPAPKGWDEDLWVKMSTKPLRERVKIAAALLVAELDRTYEGIPLSEQIQSIAASYDRVDEFYENLWYSCARRAEKYYIITKPRDENHFKYLSANSHEINKDGLTLFFVDYDQAIDTVVTLPWKFIDMSDEEFEDWAEDEKETQRILSEAKDQANVLKQQEARRKQWEELNKEFGS